MQLPEQYIQPDGSILPEDPLIPIRFCFTGWELLRKAEFEPDLGLQISHLHFTVEEKQQQDATSSALLVGAGEALGLAVGELLFPKPKALHLSGTFLIWDYRTGTPVAYGWLETASTFKFMMEKSDWKNVIFDAAESIIKDTPLKGRKYQERQNQKVPFKGNHTLGYQ